MMKSTSSSSSSPSTAMLFTPFSVAKIGAALNKRGVYLSVYCLIIAALWNTHSVLAAPAKFDLQPPIFEASAALQARNDGANTASTKDSYGNPIGSLKPIDTPDGRKVVSAQGLQFEIPNYASGITEIKKPSDDLLPPFIDKIGSSAESEEVKIVQINTKNPFLQKAFDDGKYRPQNYNGHNTATTTRRPLTTTTTTTTTTASPVEKNPFEPTIPPYLRDFDYADLGPAVPFVYDPNEDESPVDKNILPPSETIEDSNKSPAPNSSNSPFSNSQTPQGFTNQFTTSAISLSSSSSIPSKITVPHPSIQQTNQDQDVLKTATQSPPVVFVPPVPTAEGPITNTFNKNFPASFEPNTSSTSSIGSTATNADKKVPLSADRESFPPFNNVITGSSTIPSKTTFTKSEDGKVITNNIFLSGGLGSTSVKPFGFTGSEKNFGDKSTTAASVIKQFGSTSSAATSFATNSDTSVTFGAKYTGRFGGPPGVLAPQNNAFNTASTSVTRTTISSHPSATTAIAFTGTNNHKFTGSFGGPPGVLKPFDNVKSG